VSELCALLVTGTMLLWWPGASWHRLRRPAPSRRPRVFRPVPALIAAVLVVALTGGLIDGGRGVVLGSVAGAVTAMVVWTVTLERTRAERDRVQNEVARGCSELAGLLRAGHSPGRALVLVGESTTVFAEAAAHLRVGGHPVEALRRASSRPGCDGLAALAAAWQIAERTGASMTTSLDDLSDNLNAERELGRTVTTELAATRLTGRLLALLPAVGLALGYVVGGDPLEYLTGSEPGLACLAVGMALALMGVVWSEKLADRAGRLR